MAEFSEECYRRLNNDYSSSLKLSKEEDLCEGCGEWKKVVDEVGYGPLFPYLHFPMLKRKEKKLRK